MIISKTRQKRLAEQKEVKELLAVLKENNFSSAKDLMAAIGHVSDLEEQLSRPLRKSKPFQPNTTRRAGI